MLTDIRALADQFLIVFPNINNIHQINKEKDPNATNTQTKGFI